MLKVANSVISASRITGVLPVVNGGTGVTTSTGTGNTVLSATPTLSGNATLSTGNLVIGTAGKGIDFSITSSGSGTMTSELLADYEEGTWTPVLEGEGSNPSSITYSQQSGIYTKVGNLVTASFNLFTSAITGGSGNVIISGLPFACNSASLNIGTVFVYNITLSPVGSLWARFTSDGTTKLYVEFGKSAALPGNITIADWPTATIALVRATISYGVS